MSHENDGCEDIECDVEPSLGFVDYLIAAVLLGLRFWKARGQTPRQRGGF